MNRFWIVSTLFFSSVTVAVIAQAGINPGLVVPAAEQTISVGVNVGSSLDAIRLYPNPWRADKHVGKPVTFDHVPPAATIKLFTVAGQFVKIFDADENGVARWDLTNDSGVKVASGLYLYLVSTDDGQEIKGKLAVIQ